MTIQEANIDEDRLPYMGEKHRRISAETSYEKSLMGVSSSKNESESLKNHPLIQEFASVDDELYALIKATNPTLRMFVDLTKKIVNEGGCE